MSANVVSDPIRPPLLPSSTTTTLPSYIPRPLVPPPYDAPRTLLSPIWLRQHLLLLSAFSELKLAILTLELCHGTSSDAGMRDSQTCLRDLDERGRWGLFIEMAVRRFGIWQTKYIAKGLSDLPPLDVLMVWCTYLGSPRWYNEDAIRLAPYHPGTLFPDFPLDTVTQMIDATGIVLAYSPGTAAEARWKSETGLLFSPAEAFKTSNQVPIECPKCDNMFSVSWLTDERSGYGQQGFTAKCHSCHLWVTKEAFGIRRLVDDLKKLIQATSSRLASYLLPASPIATRLSNIIKFLHGPPEELGDRWGWRRTSAVTDLFSNHEDVDRSLRRLMSAYIGAERASIDLVASTMRHGMFVEKLQDLGWLEPSRWDQGQVNLDKAITRYTKFLQMAKEAPRRLLVPTLGIDIAWQTHLLLASQYVRDSKACVGHLLDREDAVEEGILSTGFDDTAQRWQSRYKVLYSTSGHLPPESKLSLRLRLWPMPVYGVSINYDLPIIYTEEDSLLSYPSERSSIFIARDDKAFKEREKRVADFRDRLTRDLKKESKGLVDAGLIRRAQEIHPAFLMEDVVWKVFGPTGYPVTKEGVIASANVMDAQVLNSLAGVGIGALGAGLEA